MTGKLIRIPHDKNFGFVRAGSTEYFFHREDYDGDWNELVFDFNHREEITLKFEIVANNTKGPRANEVSRV